MSKPRARPILFDLLILALIFIFGCYLFFHCDLLTDSSTVRQAASINCGTLRFDDIKSLDPSSPEVIAYIRCNHLYPPSSEEYALTKSKPSKLRREIEMALGNKTKGFFVECGAHDGQFLSNTLELEMRHSWTGLLVEADPVLQKKLIGKHRKSWVANVCASPNNSVTEIDFLQSSVVHSDVKTWLSAIGRLNDPAVGWHREKLGSIGTVRCFPLPTLLAALGVNHLDFLSLDVEGLDLKVLKTFPPYSTLSVDVIIVEHSHVPEGKAAMRSFMEYRGYRVVAESPEDFVFAYANNK